jgi:AraC-like DNA-binding protein
VALHRILARYMPWAIRALAPGAPESGVPECGLGNAACDGVTLRDGVRATGRQYWISITKGELVADGQPIDVLTMLSRENAAKVQQLSPAEARVRHAPDAAAFVGALRARRWHALVVDPTALCAGALNSVGVYARETGSIVLVLAPTTPLAARRVAALAGHVPVRILSVDSASINRLLSLEMSWLGTPSVRASLFRALVPALGALPPSIRAGVAACFGSLPVPRSVAAFVQGVGCSRRSVDRWARRAGLRGTASLLRSVRLAWAWELARTTPTGSWKQLAVDCGYPSPRTFRIHSRRLFGSGPAALSQLAFEGVLIERLRHDAMGPPRRSRRMPFGTNPVAVSDSN